MATPVAPALDIPVNAPEEITENPCIVLLLMLTLVVAVPPEFKIPVIAPDDAIVNISAPPVAFPNWLLLMFIPVVAAPVFEIPVNPPVAVVLVWLLIILEFILTVTVAAILEIPEKIPVPVLIPDMMLLVLISRVPVLPEFEIPLKTEAPVPYTEQFWTVLLVTDVVPVEEFVMPLNVQTPVVVVPSVPIVIELAVVVLPILFDDMIKFPATPAVLMPWNV